jgi:hypothetical protein
LLLVAGRLSEDLRIAGAKGQETGNERQTHFEHGISQMNASGTTIAIAGLKLPFPKPGCNDFPCDRR